MKMQNIVLVLSMSGLLVGAFTTIGPAAGPVQDGPPADATFVGEKACKKCHFKQHKTWSSMKHSTAWEVLSEEHRDPAQADEDGRVCISCHVTGWGKPGGFVDAETSAHLLGVQCESCHGAGSAHVELCKQMKKEKRKHFNEGEDSLQTLRTTNCSNCHNPHFSHEEYGQ